jgi:large subunit ribosomal protein L4
MNEKIMAVVNVINCKAEKVTEIDLNDNIFNVPVKVNILHDIVTMQLANRRAGTASVKHRSDVTGSGKKLFRQKGTGRARSGDIKSPLLRGGGSIFGPDPRSYSYKVPKKVRKLGLKMALSTKLQEDKILVLDQLKLEKIKTKDIATIFKQLQITKALIVTSEPDEVLERSARNLPNIKILRTEGMNVYDILKYDRLVLLESSIKKIEGRLQS